MIFGLLGLYYLADGDILAVEHVLMLEVVTHFLFGVCWLARVTFQEWTRARLD